MSSESQQALLEFRRLGRDLASRYASDNPFQSECFASPCLVAVIAHGGPPVAVSAKTTIIKPILDRWTAKTWGRRDMASICVEVLSRGLSDPVVWIRGQYLVSEIRALQNSNFVPSDVALPDTSRYEKHVNVITRTNPSELPVMPIHQGIGHFPGVQIVVFASDEEPVSEYESWLADARRGLWPPSAAFLDDDVPACPATAYGYASPYGEESRQHLLAARAGVDSRSLAAEFADRLQLPLLATQADEADFRQWEWDFTPPHDVRTELSIQP